MSPFNASFGRLGRRGFTLLEMQVALVLLFTGLFGLLRSLASLLSQVQRIEEGRPFYAYVSADSSKIILTQITSPATEHSVADRITTVGSIHLYASSMTAVVTTAPVS